MKKAKDTGGKQDKADGSERKTGGGDGAGPSIEQTYQRVSQLEHVLLRPDTYVGSVQKTDPTPMWVYDEAQGKILQRPISIVPGLYKIFDEILVNAADNKQRDNKMNLIKIDINRALNRISVYNNGKGIPVTVHQTEKKYVPELIFGTLLTSSNYDDKEKKVTGGRNGYGAKLCNIFSKEFTVETASKEYGKSFKQTWVKNMTKEAEPVVSDFKGDDFTKVTFVPDLPKFGMTELDEDIVSLMARRAFDVAGTSTGVKVFLNGKQLPVQGFKQYVELYTRELVGPDDEPLKLAYERAGPRWEVALAVSEKGFQNVSFVNSIATITGGRHVDHVADQIVARLIEVAKKKMGAKSNVTLKPFQVKAHLWVFVNCLIENPTFDSQTKETMTLNAKNFGSKCELSEQFFKQMLSCGVVDSILSWIRFKEQEGMNKKCLSKKTTKLKGIPKLEDANDAGTKNSLHCTLILTEGDSAKALAVSGLGVVGRDRYGVFPLRGKLLNVREGNLKQIESNAEITALLRIIGLQYKKKYETDEDMKSLRYGKVMIMADQDQDGSHIKGLVINFIHANWPSLIKNNFIEEFITPIVKASKGGQEISFYSIPEYTAWRENTDNWKTYKIKYYKGLGTSTSKEAKEYFTNMGRHRIAFKYAGDGDDAAVVLAFSKKKIEERKEWLSKWMEEKRQRRAQGLQDEFLYDINTKAVSYAQFINKELVLFSNADNERSIPSLVDGFKPGQRKVLFACFKRADRKEVKVAQLAGAVAELSAYHHGEQSLMGTIINLAQDFVGSNNINVLLPIGQFGTRLQGGKDSASPRYIFTQLNPVTRALFPAHDDNVLRFLFEENQRIEPEWYCPIIPTVLVNGASGIGTGWSTNIPNYNPRELAENIRRLIRGETPKPMQPWYKHFRGEIHKLDAQRFVCYGEVAKLGEDSVEITELPVKMWTQEYKEKVLEVMMEGGKEKEKDKDKNEKSKSKEPIILDFKEYHTDTTVRFVVKLPKEKMRALEVEGLHKVFKLQYVINTTSMVLFDAMGCLKKYDNPEQICSEFFEVRKTKYVERKDFLLGLLKAQAQQLTNKARFIMAKIKGEIIMENKRKAHIVEQLIKMGFDPDPVRKWKEEQKKKELKESGEIELEDELQAQENEEEANKADKKLATHLVDYDYLVGMALIKLSEEEKDKLLAEKESKLEEVRVLEGKSWGDLWEEDLERFLEELQKQEDREKADMESSMKNAGKKLGKDKDNKPDKKKAPKLALDVLPAKDAERIVPEIDKEMKEKYEKIAEKIKKEPKEKKEKKTKKTESQDIRKFANKVKKEEVDSLSGLSSEDDDDSVLFDEEMDKENEEKDMQQKREPRPQRNTARKPLKLDSTEESDNEMEVDEEDEWKAEKIEKTQDSEEEKQKKVKKTDTKAAAPVKRVKKQPKKEESSEESEIFVISSDEDDYEVQKKKKKPAPKRKAKVIDSDSGDDLPPPKKTAGPSTSKAQPNKKKNKIVSDSD